MKKQSIKETLEKIIRDNDFLEDGLYHGYVNLTSLATYLLPMVQKLADKKTTVGSITMTLSRIAETLQERKPIRLRPEDMRIRTGISYVTFPKSRDLTPTLNDISTKLDTNPKAGSQLFSQLEGSREVTVLYTAFYDPVMATIFDRFPPKIVMNNLIAIVVHIPPEYLEEKGILYHTVKQLNYF